MVIPSNVSTFNGQAITTSQKNKDCVCCAIVNFTGLPYETVDKAIDACNARHKRGGVTRFKIGDILTHLGIQFDAVKGYRILNGIFSFNRAPRKIDGHCVAVKDGIAIDNNGTTWPLKNYKLFNMTGWVIR